MTAMPIQYLNFMRVMIGLMMQLNETARCFLCHEQDIKMAGDICHRRSIQKLRLHHDILGISVNCLCLKRPTNLPRCAHRCITRRMNR